MPELLHILSLPVAILEVGYGGSKVPDGRPKKQGHCNSTLEF